MENVCDQIQQVQEIPKRLDEYSEKEIEEFPKLFDWYVDGLDVYSETCEIGSPLGHVQAKSVPLLTRMLYNVSLCNGPHRLSVCLSIRNLNVEFFSEPI
jgi:hypothetical protein